MIESRMPLKHAAEGVWKGDSHAEHRRGAGAELMHMGIHFSTLPFCTFRCNCWLGYDAWL